VSGIPGEVKEVTWLNLLNQGCGDFRPKKVRHSMVDASRVAVSEVGKILWPRVAARQPDLKTSLHEWGDGLTADESRSSGDEDASSHGREPWTT